MPPPPDSSSVAECVLDAPAEIAGLALHAEFITPQQEAALMLEIDGRPWDGSLKRRTQHYGRRFDYQRKSVATASGGASSSELPPAISSLVRALCAARPPLLPWEDGAADAAAGAIQVTVNEYEPGTGIAAHVDTHSAFADGIGSLTLGGGIAFRLQRPADGRDVSLWLPPRSLLTLAGAARYEWRHAIAGRKYDRVPGVEGGWVPRSRRVSVTVRRVLSDGRCRCAWPALCDARAGGTPVELPTRLAPSAAPR